MNLIGFSRVELLALIETRHRVEVSDHEKQRLHMLNEFSDAFYGRIVLEASRLAPLALLLFVSLTWSYFY